MTPATARHRPSREALRHTALEVRRVVGAPVRLARQLGRLDHRLGTTLDVGRLDYPHDDIYLRLDSRYAPWRLRSCAKEPWTVAWIERWLEPGETLYDVGANVGAYALVAAKVAPDARVVAFEPGYASFASLCENILLNDAAETVHPLPVALGASTCLTLFNYRELDAGAALHSLGDDGGFVAAYRQPVLSYRLDDLVATFGLRPPNHVKLDVDGAESDVLEGARDLLTSETLRSLMVEVDGPAETAIVGRLAAAGLELVERYEPRQTRVGHSPTHWSGLFARRHVQRPTAERR